MPASFLPQPSDPLVSHAAPPGEAIAGLHPPPLNGNGVRVERRDGVGVRGAPVGGDSVEDSHKVNVVHPAWPPPVPALSPNHRRNRTERMWREKGGMQGNRGEGGEGEERSSVIARVGFREDTPAPANRSPHTTSLKRAGPLSDTLPPPMAREGMLTHTLPAHLAYCPSTPAILPPTGSPPPASAAAAERTGWWWPQK